MGAGFETCKQSKCLQKLWCLFRWGRRGSIHVFPPKAVLTCIQGKCLITIRGSAYSSKNSIIICLQKANTYSIEG